MVQHKGRCEASAGWAEVDKPALPHDFKLRDR